jgi:hypothetical protein
MKALISLTLISMSLVACSKLQNQVDFAGENKFEEPGSVGPEPAPVSCELNPAEYLLDARLVSFEFISKSEISFGFDLFKGWLKAFGVSFKAKSAQMTMVMDLYNPLRPQNAVANSKGIGKLNKTELNLDLDLGKAQGNIGYLYQTPIHLLTTKTLLDSIAHAKLQIDELKTPWFTRVQLVRNDVAVVPVGSLSGLRVNDELSLYNTEQVWKGRPCESELVGEYNNPEAPVAIGRIIELNESFAFLKLSGDVHAVKPGAKVTALKLAKKDKKEVRILKRSAQIRTLAAGDVRLENGAKIDLVPFVKDLLKPALRESGFFIR